VRRNLSEQRKPRGGDGEQGPDFLICVHELHQETVAEDFRKVQLRGRRRECLGGASLEEDAEEGFFSDLEDLARGEGDFGLGISQFSAIDFDTALGDEAAGLGIAGDSLRFLDEFSDREGGGGGAKGFHFSRGEIFFGELGFEVGAGGGGGAFSVEATDGSGGELLFCLHGVGGRFLG